MANFTIRATGITVPAWVDAVGALPSRLNPTTGLPHKYWAVPPLGQLVVLATPDGLAEAAPDSLLGGNLFLPYWVETPYSGGPAIVQSTGFSSTMTTQLSTPGHYLLGVFRSNGGQQLLHLTCE